MLKDHRLKLFSLFKTIQNPFTIFRSSPLCQLVHRVDVHPTCSSTFICPVTTLFTKKCTHSGTFVHNEQHWGCCCFKINGFRLSSCVRLRTLGSYGSTSGMPLSSIYICNRTKIVSHVQQKDFIARVNGTLEFSYFHEMITIQEHNLKASSTGSHFCVYAFVNVM